MKIQSMGFPRMHKEESERRDFLPTLFKRLGNIKDLKVFLEEGYGSGMGFTKEDYLMENKDLIFANHNEIYEKDMVVVLRAPQNEEINMMKTGSILVSMLHYETRPLRNKLLMDKGIKCFSMDGMADDRNKRMLVNFKGTSRSGVQIAFNELKNRMADFHSPTRRPIYAVIVGMGDVGFYAARAFKEFGNQEFLYKNNHIPGIIIQMVSRSITKDQEQLKNLLITTDILVDSSKRADPSQHIISNDLLGYLPDYAVILDLAADPYNEKTVPIQVKGIEGIPTGTLDKLVIETDDPIYTTIPKGVKTDNRRVVVSCNAWPGVDPKGCMEIYGEQIDGFLALLMEKDVSELSIDSGNIYERSLVRSSLDYYLATLNE